ncbi:unnamed protein product, partial [Brassica rapa subsp. narinosa]
WFNEWWYWFGPADPIYPDQVLKTSYPFYKKHTCLILSSENSESNDGENITLTDVPSQVSKNISKLQIKPKQQSKLYPYLYVFSTQPNQISQTNPSPQKRPTSSPTSSTTSSSSQKSSRK